jgi:hypothetical protein
LFMLGGDRSLVPRNLQMRGTRDLSPCTIKKVIDHILSMFNHSLFYLVFGLNFNNLSIIAFHTSTSMFNKAYLLIGHKEASTAQKFCLRDIVDIFDKH